ncbi:beta strand repeat-containing protein [Methanosphaera cuniculi]|uniref:beta strand repeat-containing protein n=1 Tax=Methanosphaera cuniculi TaxID=1077256 RepID=UPI0026DD7575|nr:hypothetical protein [Methanosphaera cuniculi]
MQISATSSVILNNIIIADCHAEKGGAIYDEGTLRINNVSFINNTVPANGGAIYTTAGSSLFIEKSTFDSNKQTEHVSGNSKGYNGGALSVRGTLYINDSTFINNLASYTNTQTDSDGGNGGAIAFVTSTNDLTITNSRFDNNSARHGGAILIMNLNSDEGIRTIKNVTFTNNQGVYGTIVTYNTLTINNSTFKNNVMSGYGSGSNQASGGAILINSYNKTASPKLTVNNSIFDKNEAYDGGVIDIASVTKDCKNATVTINNSTFKNNNATNGGAIYLEYGDITIENSIFDNNTGKLGGALYLKGHANINNSTFANNNATSNGGAINVYNVNVLSANPYTLNIKNSKFTDNIAKTNGGAIATQHIAVNNTTFTNNKAGAKGGAIHSANTAKTMPININNSKFTQNTAGSNGGAVSLNSLTIITNTNFTDNKAMTGGAIYATINNLTITNSNFNNNKANSTTSGGAVYSSGNLNITNNNFTDNTATLKGGAIFITPNKNLTISDSKFNNNKAINETNYTYGGAIYTSAHTNITNTEFTNNNASYGGAIYFTRNDTSNITNSKFTNNIAANRGGAIYNNASSTLDITNTIFDKNSHTNTTKANNNDYGGAAIFSEGGLHITSTNFTNNHANYTHGVANSDGGNGGAIVHYNSIKDLIIKNSNFNNNSARHGGSILIYNGDSDDGLRVIENTTFNGSVGVYGTIETYNSLNITSTVFANNTMEDYGSGNRLGSGGAIVLNSYFTAQSIKLSIDNSTFENNTATEGGVIRAGSPVPTTFAAPTLEITNSNFKNNHAYSTGGAISTYPADITITNTNFTNNKADNWGGAISTGISNLTITGSKFTNNSATKYGGAIYVNSGSPTVGNSSFKQNSANVGGALYNAGTLTLDTNNFVNNNGANGEIIYTTKALNTNDNTINLDDRTAFANQTTTISSPITDTSGSNNYVYEIYDPEGNLENTVNAILIDNSRIVANYTFTNTGIYTVKLTYSGSVNNIEMKVTVGKSAITEITIDEIGLKHPQDSITISGVVNSESGIVAGETVIIYINGKQVATVVTDSEGKYSYTATITTKTTVNDGFISLLPGRNNIDVSINEDSIYLKFTNSTDVIVSKLNTIIAIDNINNVIAGDSVTINGKLTDSEANVIANGKLTITVNGVTYTLTTDKDGKFSQVIPTTKAGNLNIITTYDGNERYDANHKINTINVTKRNTVLSINNTDTSLINDTFIVNGKLTTDDNNILDNAPILITINGMNYITHSDANGSFTLNVTAPNKTGNHTINAVYIGNDSFMSSTTNSQVNVKKLSTTTTVENITSKVNSNAVFTAKVVDEKGNAVLSGKVVFKLNNKTIGIVNIINGIASMEYKVINSPKDYEITAKYAESSAYTSSETIGVLHVIKRDANITLMNISESIVGDKINIVAIVAEDEGIANDGIVIFKINGVTLRNSDGGAVNSTVVNGIASISYTIPSSFSAKNYTITAVYSNNNYNRVESTVNLTIIKSNAKTQLSPISTVHGENTTLNITLYDQKGRQIIRDNKLAVKINGKTYVHSVYTNGSANIVIPTESLKTGHYNLTIVFGANNAYNSLRLDTILFITMPVIDDSQNSTMKNETEIKAL